MLRLFMLAATGLIVACSSAEDAADDDGDSGGQGGSEGGAENGAGGSSDSGDAGSSAGGSSDPGGAGDSGGTGGSGGSVSTAGTAGRGGGKASLPAGDCALAAPAFCEKFETPHPGGRGGDLDESRWSFARWNHGTQYMWFRMPAGTYEDSFMPATFCGEPFSGILPPDDVRTCDGVGVDGVVSGQLHEVFDDQGDFAFQAMRIRQPFDFTGREGRITWDVDGKINPYNGGHGWWHEVWITADPQPLPYHEAPVVTAVPRSGIGFALRFGANNCEHTDDSWGNALEAVVVAQDYDILHWYDDAGWEMQEERCFRSMDAKLNHFEVRLTQDRAEFWASDYEDPSTFKLRAVVDNLDLDFSVGYVHFQHSHYNAHKDGAEGCEEGVPNTCPSPSQTFRWDNIGFDGPVYSTPKGFDVLDNDEEGPEGGIYIGWYLNDREIHSFTVPAVDVTGGISATFNFNVLMENGQELLFRLNGGEWHSYVLPFGPQEATTLRSFSVDVPLDELVSGDNEIEVQVPELISEIEGIGNLDLTVEIP